MIDQIIEKLNQNKILAINNGYTFELIAKPSLTNKVKLYDIRHKPHNHRIKFVFSDFDQLKTYTKGAVSVKYLPSLMSLINHGTIFTMFTPEKFFHQKTSNISLASTDFLREITSKFGPILSTPANLYKLPPATSIDILKTYFPDIEVVNTDGYLDNRMLGLEPGVINCLHKSKVVIENLVFVDKAEIQSILPNVKVDVNISKHKPYFRNLDLILIKNKSQIPENVSVVMGTKEKLNKEFTDLPIFFSNLRLENFHIINLGSESNPEILTKNFYKHIYEAYALGCGRVHILYDEHNTKNMYMKAYGYVLNKFGYKLEESLLQKLLNSGLNKFYLDRLLTNS